jgi:hypothetical protein
MDTMDPADRKALDAAQADIIASTRAQSQQEAGTEAGLASIEAGKATDAENYANQAQKIANDSNAEIDRLTAEHERRSKAVQEISANYGWHPSTGQRITYGIASALGAFGAAITHSPNFAAQTIEAAINRDLDAQQKQIEAAKGRVNDLDTTLAAAYRKTGNMQQALSLAREAGLQKAAAQTAEFVHANASQTALVKGQGLIAALQASQANERASHMRQFQTGGGGTAPRDLMKEYKDYTTDWLKGPQKTEHLSLRDWLKTQGGGSGSPAAAGTQPQLREGTQREKLQTDADLKTLQGMAGRAGAGGVWDAGKTSGEYDAIRKRHPDLDLPDFDPSGTALTNPRVGEHLKQAIDKLQGKKKVYAGIVPRGGTADEGQGGS